MSKTYVVPDEIALANSLEAKLEHLKNIKGSFSVYRIDCGSCNGCEIEIFAAITPMWDPERFGFKLVANPRHADILVCSGPVTRQMYYPLLRAYEAAPDPKVVVAIGACGSSGGIFHDAYSVWGGIDKVIPVDVYIPGCPPHPATIIHGLATALGILDQKLELKEHKNGSNSAPKLEEPLLNNILFERDVLAEAKQQMGYLFGRKLYKKYMSAIKESPDIFDTVQTRITVERLCKEEEDPRYVECMKVIHNDIYLSHMKKFKEIDEADKIQLGDE
jgi:Ni,Fe-hydrogenase III small subunit